MRCRVDANPVGIPPGVVIFTTPVTIGLGTSEVCPSSGGGCGCGCGSSSGGSNIIIGDNPYIMAGGMPRGGGGFGGGSGSGGGGGCGCGGGSGNNIIIGDNRGFIAGDMSPGGGVFGSGSGGGGGGSCCECSCGGVSAPAPLQPTVGLPTPIPVSEPVIQATSAESASYGSSALDFLQGSLNGVRHNVTQPLGEMHSTLASFPHVEPSKGIVYAMLTPPAGGPFDPQPLWIFAGKTPAASAYGYGWNSTWDRSVTQVDSSTANVNVPSSEVYQFTSKNVSGYYTPAPGLASSLQIGRGRLDRDHRPGHLLPLRRFRRASVCRQHRREPLDPQSRWRGPYHRDHGPVFAAHHPGL